jgi:tetratricopeptide (TPR) repeat protein
MKRNVRFGVLLVAGLAAALLRNADGLETHAGKNSQSAAKLITFNRDIAPVLFRYCTACHRPGESAPFSLLNYADAKSHARQIAAVTQARVMPPWLPAEGEYKLADELRLTNEQIGIFKQWVEDGEVEGAASDLPPQPKFVQGWQIGKPDLILKAAKPYQLPASGSDQYWNFIFRMPIKETRWLKAMEIRPGDQRLVHHANVLVDRLESSRAQEKSPGAGFGGMELKIESEAFDPDSHFLFWKPGTVPYTEPEGMALRLDPGADLVLNVHLQPSGKPEWIQPTIGLYFTDHPATKFPMLLQLENDAKLDIPAGARDFVVTDDFTLPEDVELLAIYPHAHYLGRDLESFAIFPDGTKKLLLHIPNWDLNWQAVYRYQKPVHLPAGTIVSMHYVYDNSENNPLNPNSPPKRVMAGNRASDEMAHLWLQVLPDAPLTAGSDPRRILQEALARHNIEKNPEDFEAHYNLGAMLQQRGDLSGAMSEYESALRIRPENAIANNGYAAIVMAAGHPEAAVKYLTAALRARPDYFDACYNLGLALAMQNDFAGAEKNFREAVRLHPDDANAEANLGSALAELGKRDEALQHLQRALALDPSLRFARENLEQLQQGSSQNP